MFKILNVCYFFKNCDVIPSEVGVGVELKVRLLMGTLWAQVVGDDVVVCFEITTAQ